MFSASATLRERCAVTAELSLPAPSFAYHDFIASAPHRSHRTSRVLVRVVPVRLAPRSSHGRPGQTSALVPERLLPHLYVPLNQRHSVVSHRMARIDERRKKRGLGFTVCRARRDGSRATGTRGRNRSSATEVSGIEEKLEQPRKLNRATFQRGSRHRKTHLRMRAIGRRLKRLE